MYPSRRYSHQDIHIFAEFTKHHEIHFELDKAISVQIQGGFFNWSALKND